MVPPLLYPAAPQILPAWSGFQRRRNEMPSQGPFYGEWLQDPGQGGAGGAALLAQTGPTPVSLGLGCSHHWPWPLTTCLPRQGRGWASPAPEDCPSQSVSAKFLSYHSLRKTHLSLLFISLVYIFTFTCGISSIANVLLANMHK